MISTFNRMGLLGGGGVPLLPFSDDFARADGAIGNGWTGATWTIATNKAVNTPTLGSELFTVTDFASDTVWTKGTGWTIAGGVASHTGSSGNITQAVATANNWYRIAFTMLNWSAGAFGISGFAEHTANGTYIDAFRASSATAGIAAATNAVSDADNASLKLLTLNTLFASKDFSRNDVDASVKLTIVKTNPCGLVLNLDSSSSPANFVVAYHNGTNAILEKCVAGTYTSLINTAVTYSAGAVLEVKKSGTTYQLFYNAVQRGADQSVSDVGIISNTIHGLFSTYEGDSLDDFSILAN